MEGKTPSRQTILDDHRKSYNQGRTWVGFEGWIGLRCVERSREGSLEGDEVAGMAVGLRKHVKGPVGTSARSPQCPEELCPGGEGNHQHRSLMLHQVF